MISKYGIFCKVVEVGSFTKVAGQIGYSQSAVSQTIKSLEQETGTVLIDRRKDGIALTADGEQFLPYLQAIFSAEEALGQKQREMEGLENSTICIGTFTSVSRNILPQLMKAFKNQYPGVNFILKQGEYTSIGKWVQDGSVDFGLVNADAVAGIDVKILYRDEMMAVLPKAHPLADREVISLQELGKEPFILLDEGDYSVMRNAFMHQKICPKIEYEVYDDYSILAMVRQGLGVSAMYRLVLDGFEEGLEIRPVREKPQRPVALAWQNWETMSFASRRFAEFIMENINKNQKLTSSWKNDIV